MTPSPFPPMAAHWKRLILTVALIFLLPLSYLLYQLYHMEDLLVPVPVSERSLAARERTLPRLMREARAFGLRVGAPMFVRAFKESRELEVWREPSPGAPWRLFRTYTILNYGGGPLGPKFAEGDGISPEGFYQVAPAQLNPLSQRHLSFNVGYPNEFDQAHGRTGSFIMVHGGDDSRGCLAVGDEATEEIYVMAEAALRHGQRAISVHLFPFRLEEARLRQETQSPHFAFWKNLQEGYALFETTHRPPTVTVQDGRYVFTPAAP